MGDGEYLAAFQQIIMPIAREYNPELVLVSAGFDAARGDPLGGCHVSPACYATMTHMLCGLAQGRVILALEGGYNLTSISESMTLCTCVLLGDPCPVLQYQPPCQSAVRSICDTLDVHKHYWKSLKFRAPIQCTNKSDLNQTTCSSDLTPSDVSTSCTEPSRESSFEMDQLADEMKAISVHESNPADGSTKPKHESSPVHARAHSSPKLRYAHSHDDSSTRGRKLEVASGELSRELASFGTDFRLEATWSGATSGSGSGGAKNGFDDTLKKETNGLNMHDGVGVTESNLNGRMESYGASADNGACSGDPLEENCSNSATEGACGGAEAPESDGILIDGMEPEGFVVPLPWCPHLEQVCPMPDGGLNVKTPCGECGTNMECWLCLTCYQVYCGRFVNEHMLLHGVTHEHYMVLSYADLSVWCYGCDSYVNNEIVFPMKRAAHINKFNIDVPCIM